MAAETYSFIDIAALPALRERFAAGEALLLLSRDLATVFWVNGPGAALFAGSDIDALTDAPSPLGTVARRQIAALPGFPALGEGRGVAVRVATGVTSRILSCHVRAVALPDGEAAILVAVPGGEPSAERAIQGIAQDGQFAAMLDGEGNVLAASPGFAALQLSPRLSKLLIADAASRAEGLVKRKIEAAGRILPAGLVHLSDEANLLIVVDEGFVELGDDIFSPGEAEAFEADAGEAVVVPPDAGEPEGPLDAGVEIRLPEEIEEDWYFNGSGNGMAQSQDRLAELSRSAPVRFSWRTDPDGRFTAVSPDFLDAVELTEREVIGQRWSELAERFDFDRDGGIAARLAGRDTWSGSTVLWPLAYSQLAVPVDFAALPTFSRARSFEGFRGFGVARLADAVMRPDEEPAPAEEEPADEEEPRADASMPAEAEPAANQPSPTLKDQSDQVVRLLAEHRQPSGERSLSPTERIAFQEIGKRLKDVAPTAATPIAGEASSTVDPAPSPVQPLLAEPAMADVELPRAEPREAAEAALEQAATAADFAADEGFTATGTESAAEETAPVEAEEGGAGSEALAAEEGFEPRSAEPAEETATSEAVQDAALDDFGDGTEAAPAGQSEPGFESAADEPVFHLAPLEMEAEAESGSAAEPTPSEDTAEVLASETPDEPHSVVEPETSGPDAQAPEHRLPAEKEAAQAAGPLPADDAYGQSLEEAPVETPELAQAPIEASSSEGGEEPLLEAGERTEGLWPQWHAEERDASPVADIRLPEAMPVHAPADAGFPAAAEPASAPAGTAPQTALLEEVPVPLLVHAGDRLHYANSEFLALSGYPSLQAFAEAGGLGALFGETPPETGDGRLRLRAASGASFPVETLLRSVPWAEGKALLLVLRRVEEPAAPPETAVAPPREDAEARLAELRAIVDTATDGVVVIAPDLAVRSLSRPAEALFGMDSADAAGKPFGALFAAESQRTVADYLDGLADNGVASVLNDGREVIGRERSGGAIPLFMTIGTLPEKNGFCAVLRDITQWKRAEEELTQSRALAERASSHKTEFLARVSHEIRTPLNAIIGFSELMLDEKFGAIGSDRYRDYLRDINRSGNHVLALVNDLLDISKIEAGQQEMAYEAVSLNDALNETVATMQPQANRERVIIRSSLGADLPEVVADRRSIRQIALNILSNAIRFTPAGGQVIVSTAVEPTGDVTLRVRDTGIGMSQAEIEQALKPFKQINSLKHSRTDGTGLGLPLTKAMVEANRARFAIASTPGEGTLVEVVFPSTRVLA